MKDKGRIKKRTYEILEAASPGDIPSKIFDYFIIILISLNVIAVMLETVKSLYVRWSSLFRGFEILSISIFTVEYIFRVWGCTVEEKYRHPLTGRIKFIFTPMALVDLFAILPFYLPMVIPFDLRFIRILRLFRIFRLFKIERYFEALKILGNVLKNTKEELSVTFFVLLILLVIVSTLMFFAEHEAQPEAFSNVFEAMWWGIVTLTTVGYGDVYPVTPLGKILAGIIAILGIGMFALPAGILASGFSQEIRKRRKIICPHCGKEIEIE
ncbi:ion transporter [bacterium]|nr:MAG: ion transporter [bacterium]